MPAPQLRHPPAFEHTAGGPPAGHCAGATRLASYAWPGHDPAGPSRIGPGRRWFGSARPSEPWRQRA